MAEIQAYYAAFFFGIMLAVLSLFIMVRNAFVLSARVHVITRPVPHWEEDLARLPDYDGMLFQLRYMHLWTESQWMNWLETRT